MKKQNLFSIVFSIFTVVGIGLLIVAAVIYANEMQFRKSAVKVTGEIVDILTGYHNSSNYDDREITHEVYVTYTFGGETYERVQLHEYDSNMYVGGSITLLCDPDNPRKVKTESGFYLLVLLFGGIGIVFSCIGIIPMIFSAGKKKRKKHLLANGRLLHATVERIDLNRNISANGQHPYVIYCEWEDENAGIQYRFKSENLWTDPGFIFEPGSNIDVYVKENDFSKYYVDAERELSKKVVDFT
ncbi:MAG: DUF3592 domain-containing protein [Roseburia sp.]|nr:DUF3592 domain-containing protein [Roseburia sp.]MCM1280030.1 DUF3592 domain-containing protein [Robinsoniella sp.]